MSAAAGQGAPAGDGGGEAQQQGQQQGEGDGAPGLEQIAQSLAQNQTTTQEMFDYLRQQQQQQAPEATQQTPQEPAPLDLSGLYDDSGFADPQQMASQLGGLIESTMQQRLEAGLEPLRQQLSQEQEQRQEMQREQGFAALIGEFPELGEEDAQRQVLQMSGQLAEVSGHPEIGGEPWFVRLTYLAGRAVDAAQEEQGEIPAPAHMESGAGAAPAGGPGAMTAEQIVGARRGASVLPFG